MGLGVMVQELRNPPQGAFDVLGAGKPSPAREPMAIREANSLLIRWFSSSRSNGSSATGGGGQAPASYPPALISNQVNAGVF